MNICTLTDSYKLGHHLQYPEHTQEVYSYFESRLGAKFSETVFFGLQPLLQKYFEGRVVTAKKIQDAEDLASEHMFNPHLFKRERWGYILSKYDGHLPLKIKAVPEGTPVTVDNVMMTVVNTDPRCYWLTGHVETVLTHLWFASTVATLSREVKKLCKQYLEETSYNMDHLSFMLHDFGFRGVSSCESAGAGGAGHLINFLGTDTIAAIEHAKRHYDSGVCGHSVPATEHSIMTSLGRDGEMEVMRRLLKTHPTGILSVVIDSYNYEAFIENTAKLFKKEILERDGKVVFRPDSGDPVQVAGRCFDLLAAHFGCENNPKGYDTLNPKVGLIWGDGIDFDGIHALLESFKTRKASVENIVFGMGGGLLQKINRDTQRFAFKSSYQLRGGVGYDIFKDPIDTSKKSKKGRLKLTRIHGAHGSAYETCRIEENNRPDILQEVFSNGKIVKRFSFDEVKNNARL